MSDAGKRPIDVFSLWTGSQELLALADQGLPHVEFLRESSRILTCLFDCDALHLELSEDDVRYAWDASRDPSIEPKYRPLGKGSAASPGNDWTYSSKLELAVPAHAGVAGRMVLLSRKPGYFPVESEAPFASVVRSFGLAAAGRRAQARLRERIKELSCMYEISRLVREPEGSLERTLEAIVQLLPAAWQFPEIAGARLLIGPRRHVCGDRSAARHVQTAAVTTHGRDAGVIEVFYTADRAEFAEGAFLREEQSLIEGVAREIGQLLERNQAGAERARLEEQVRRADRLATIGQLAAGMAHELNEPLGAILGFAQLMEKSAPPGDQSARDLKQIIDAALHGRRIIQNLLLFARKTPGVQSVIDVNTLASECLAMFESRGAKHAVNVRLSLVNEPAIVAADGSQLRQVLTNLAINGIQAMPRGGVLTIGTEIDERADRVILRVSDTGIGMSEELRRRIFDPFFTTKEVGEGTGLGLSVVLGIVESHGGEIRVESEPGRGSTFIVALPRCHDAPGGGE